jgi:RNA polymerase sigma-70 factor (ECF subfamily)
MPDPQALAALLARAKRYDREAFGELYRVSVRPVFRYVSARVRTPEEAEEVTQEVYLAALSGIQTLRATTEAALYAWLFQIARFKLADHVRGRYRNPAQPLDESVDPRDPDPQVEEVLVREAAREEQRERLQAAMAELTDEQREVMLCKYVLGYSNEQTAQRLSKNVNAVNQLHHRALRSLQRLLAAKDAVL